MSGFSYAAQSLRCLLRAGVCFDSSVDLLYCGDKKEEFCVRQCGCGLMSVCSGLREVLTCERMLTLSCFWRCLQACVSGGLFLGTSVVTSGLLQVYSI